MTKEAWLSHMDDEHEGREQWICHVCSQKNIYATFRESSEFTAHVEQDHSKGIKPQQIPMLLSAWRCKIPLEISTCPLCRFESDDQNAVLDHIAEHIHSFSLRSLPWAPREGLEEENDEEEYGTYFKQHPYFDIHSSRSELSSNSPGMSSVITDTGSFAGDDFENPAESPRQQQAELTEDLLNQVPYGVSGQVNTSDWLAMLSNDPENPNPSPGNVLADWNVDDLPSLYKQVGPDWFAVFNTEVQRVLDVELVHHLVHDSVVSCVRFSWDGKYVATGCCRSANIFDVATGQSVATLQDESVDGDIIIRSVCFSPDGEHLATGSEDNQIRIWDIATRSIKHVFTGHEEEVHSLDFAGNGRYITSGSADKTVRVWDVLEGKLIYTLSISYGFTTVAISPNGVSFPNGVYIAAGALDNGVRIWDMTTGYLVERLENPDGHKDCVYSVAFAPNGRDLVSGSLDKTIKMWELTAPRGMLPGTGVKGGKCVQTFEGHKV
ncbi:hypothetical protein EIK77_009742 [Talaromyces pinophilus]|nr:hypothetical protein EIK77_009742 [Talaromyces pinophilus]